MSIQKAKSALRYVHVAFFNIESQAIDF